MLIVPAGLLIFGWTAEAKLHFMLPLFGAGVFAFGILMTYVRSHLLIFHLRSPRFDPLTELSL